jgi:excisionase family DNA binding protein
VNRRLLSAEEAGEYLGIRKGTLYVWARKGTIPSVKIGRRLLFDVRDLDEMIERVKRGRLPEATAEEAAAAAEEEEEEEEEPLPAWRSDRREARAFEISSHTP